MDLTRISPVLAALIVVTALLLVTSPRAHASSDTRAMWIWGGESLFRADELNQFVTFAQAPHGNPEHSIDLVFLSVRGGFPPATWSDLARVVGRLSEAGITVHALAGDPSWALNHSTPLFRLEQVLDYNAQAAPGQRIEGFQFDVEPYLVRDRWNTPEGFQELKAGFLNLMVKLNGMRDERDSDFEIGVAIPRWYDQEQYDYLNRDLQAITDYVAVMNYWNELGRLIRDGAGELEAGDEFGKKVYMGVEVQKIDPPTITFYGYTVGEMEAVLDQAVQAFAEHESYAGLVIHHYNGYREMVAGE